MIRFRHAGTFWVDEWALPIYEAVPRGITFNVM